MEIVRVTAVDDDLVAAIARLVPQLSPTTTPPDRATLEELVASPGARLLIARDTEIVGVLVLTLYRILTRLSSRIDDVIVDTSVRGKGIGEALSRAAIELAREAGAKNVALTSRPDREAANRLYQRIGFERVPTNVYRFQLR